MTAQHDEHPNDSLLRRFREELQLPLSERFYSEEELLTVFDVAGDHYNDYLRTEALLLGMRLYPDSKELLARRAILYRDIDPQSFGSFLNDSPETQHTALLEIMRLSNLDCPRAEAQRQMQEFLETHRLDDDEEVIQFVQAAHALGLQKWLVSRLPDIRKKISYLPTLLYEVAVLSDESPEFAKVAVKLLEELTEIEPYSPDYWVLLSHVYIREERYSEALGAIEYALAIDPDNIEALRAKLRAMSQTPDAKGIESIMKRIMDLDPNDLDLAMIRLVYMRDTYGPSGVHSALATMPPQVGASAAVVTLAIESDYPDLPPLLEAFYKAGHTSVEEWNDLMNIAFDVRHSLICVIEDTFASLTDGTEKLDRSLIDYKMLFRYNQYDTAIAMFGNPEIRGALRSRDQLTPVYAAFVLMLLRSGHLDDAFEACKSMKDVIDDPMNRMQLGITERYGMNCFINEVLKKIASRRKTDWYKFDPMDLDNKF